MQDRIIPRHTLIYCRRMWCLNKYNTFSGRFIFATHE
jgi:hypothetical protein